MVRLKDFCQTSYETHLAPKGKKRARLSRVICKLNIQHEHDCMNSEQFYQIYYSCVKWISKWLHLLCPTNVMLINDSVSDDKEQHATTEIYHDPIIKEWFKQIWKQWH